MSLNMVILARCGTGGQCRMDAMHSRRRCPISDRQARQRDKTPPMTGEIAYIRNAETLTRHFRGWPSFHDAEVTEVNLWRGHVKGGDWDDSNVFPIVTIAILILRATQAHEPGTGPDILATLRFHEVTDVRLEDFNHVNQVLGLTITTEDRGHFTTGEPMPPSLLVSLERGFGLAAWFRCFRIEVIDAVPVSADTLSGPPS